MTFNVTLSHDIFLHFCIFFRFSKMAALVARGGRVAKLVNSTTSTANIACLHTGSARLADAINQPVPWNYLWKPGPYPETEDAKVCKQDK